MASHVAARIREEVAVLVVLAGRDGRALQVDLVRRLRGGANDFGSLAELLWPPQQQYRVATVIFGTRQLADLGRLLPGAQQWPLVGSRPPVGAPTLDLRTMLDRAQKAPGNKMLLIVPVDATDAYTAVAQARRTIVETLDQYAAGQRLLGLEIGPASVAIGVDNRPTMSLDLGGGAKLARPLTVHWAAPVRPALRMASLAGSMDAPVASVMLAWGALESLGVDAGTGLELVAKACALHSVRQQLISCFKSVTAAASARVDFARQSVYWTGRFLGQAERAHQRVSAAGSARAGEALRALEERLPELRSRHAAATSAAAAVTLQAASKIGVIQCDLLGGSDPDHPLQASSYSLDVNHFLDAMLPAAPTPTADPASASREALITLAEAAGGLAREQFLSWRGRLADPTMLADWIDIQQNGFHGLLAWMYASRNLAIHTGGFVVPADVLTAEAARGIVDMVLEFLGHWYKHLDTHGRPDQDAVDIIQSLAVRKDRLIDHLRAATSCHPLNVATITGPDSDCWNRT